MTLETTLQNELVVEIEELEQKIAPDSQSFFLD
jgi:hypothetical protein